MAKRLLHLNSYCVISACRAHCTVCALPPCLNSNAANAVMQEHVKEQKNG